MTEYRSALQGRLIPDSERDYYKAITDAYSKAVILLNKTNGKYTQTRLESIIKKISKELLEINKDFRSEFKGELIDITDLDIKANTEEFALTSQARSEYPDLYIIPKSDIRNLIQTDNFLFTFLRADGTTRRSTIQLQSLLANPTVQAIKDLRSAIVTGATLGHSPNRIADDLRHNFTTKQKSNVRTVVNTLISNASAATDREFQERNKKFISHHFFLATIDTRTSAICRSLSGLTIQGDIPRRYWLPLHPNERSKWQDIPRGYTRANSPVNLMTASDKKTARQMQKDYLKFPINSDARNAGIKAREKYLKERIFISPKPLTFKEAADLYEPLRNKRPITMEQYQSLLGF